MNLAKDFDLEGNISKFIEVLSEYGKTEEGGINRVLYSQPWIDAQKALKDICKKKEFESYYDEVGNLFVRLEGTEFKDETILTGSHIDTVVNGGKLDGQLGIVAGVLAMEYLKTKYGDPLRNIEMVSMVEEEGSRFPFTFWGSKNIVGCMSEEEVKDLKDEDGIDLARAMKTAGFRFKDKTNIRNDIKAFIELHIEQGGVLEIEKKSIGIVEHIVGQKRFLVEVKGEANHAGTTPMGYRRDSLHGASRMISKIMELAKSYGDPLVATVGRLDVSPNTSNVVPGKVIFSIDLRHTQKDTADKFVEEMKLNLKEIAKEMDLDLNIDNYMNGVPVSMDKDLVNIIKTQAEENNLNYKLMHSGAGHDAQIFATHVPTALIFVPSHKGISHNPLEFTETKDLVEGVKVLIKTLYELAYK